jgi:hypothetical protein
MPGEAAALPVPIVGRRSSPAAPSGYEPSPIQPRVTEYQLHQLVCPACGEATRAESPPGGPWGEFSLRVQAITALCTGAYHLSKRTTQTALEGLFGVSTGLGTVANLEQAATQVLTEPVAEARAMYRLSLPLTWRRQAGAKSSSGHGCGSPRGGGNRVCHSTIASWRGSAGPH